MREPEDLSTRQAEDGTVARSSPKILCSHHGNCRVARTIAAEVDL